MDLASLVSWVVTILAGLLLLVIWIMEYDRDYQRAAATRLPIPVIGTHAFLGMSGLVLWGSYLLVDEDRLAWATIVVLGTVATLGLIMAWRWIGVYRTYGNPGPSMTSTVAVPPERRFPVPLVLGHGLLAVTTLGLVLFTVFGTGS